MAQLKINDALNKVYLRQKPLTEHFNQFCEQLDILKNSLEISKEKNESEEHIKNLIIKFLQDSFYAKTNLVNTKERIDCAIYETLDSNSPVQVLIEAKRPGSMGFPTLKNLNSKALQETVLYYMRERVLSKNIDLKHIVITDGFQWFVFEASEFEKYFCGNKDLQKHYNDFEVNPTLFNDKTSMFYNEIASPIINKVKNDLDYVYFDIRNLTDQRKISVYKLLSPQHLLRRFVCNDSNELNSPFYNELLYILGLEEVADGNKRKICRLKSANRNRASIIENAINQIEDTVIGEERQFEIALSLAITWINRILFLKLLESQLVNYHKGDATYRFLNSTRIGGFDDLHELFFKVLAVPTKERKPEVAEKYRLIPYLNSSLFEMAENEDRFKISGLRDDAMPVHNQTVLYDNRNSKRLKGELQVLDYLFRFLDAYDFGSEPDDDSLTRDNRKSIINASVLGLIFEKINGYKDGSFFTPGVITQYMCRESLRRAVVQKFNDAKGWNCQTFDELVDKDLDKAEANQIINSLRICDPAVGSGHFLVSALNELIAIKADLKVLLQTDGKRLKYGVSVENDELMIDDDGEPFVYNPKNAESQLVQESLFAEKRSIIENCLFGVDINPNSVNICRLRLWIELLKNAYYKQDGEFETLPNIDINIKCGNSLVSRYPIETGKAVKNDTNLSKEIKEYKKRVKEYKSENNKVKKQEVKEAIKKIKEKIVPPIQFKLELDASFAAENRKAMENSIYRNSMEWMIEFPEVLDDEGRFNGFDVVIGNPPYIKEYDNKSAFDGFRERSPYYVGKMDLWHGFACMCIDLIKQNGYLNFIAQNNWTTSSGAKKMREKIICDSQILQMLDFNTYMVFENADIQTMVMLFKKNQNVDNYSIDFRLITQGNEKEDMLALLAKQMRNTKYSTPLVNRKALKNKLLTFSDNSEIFEKIALDKTYLDDNEVAQGIVFPQDFLDKKGAEKLGNIYPVKTGVFGLSQAEKESMVLNNKELELIRPYFTTEQIHRYYTEPSNTQWLIYTDSSFKKIEKMKEYPNIKEHLDKFIDIFTSDNKPYGLHRCRKQDFFQGEKVISLRKCVENPCFSYSNFDCYVTQTFFSIKTTRWDMKFLTGVLNSKLVAFWLKHKGKMQGNNYQVDKEPLQGIPLPQIKTDENVVALVNQIMEAKKQNQQADTEAIEREIDMRVYKLYGLTLEESQIIDASVTAEDFDKY